MLPSFKMQFSKFPKYMPKAEKTLGKEKHKTLVVL
jgi:hypothetical protein